MIFSLEILKNYIVRCDFWSCRHFAGRLVFLCCYKFICSSEQVHRISEVRFHHIQTLSLLRGGCYREADHL